MKEPQSVPRAPVARAPLSVRQARRRRAGRAAVAGRVVVPISETLRTHDPLVRARRSATPAVLAVLGALLVHGLVGALAYVPRETARVSAPVRIDVRETPPPLPAVEAEKKAEPAPAPPPPPRRPRKVAVVPPPAAPPSPQPPARVVGISLDSTGVGGDGASFAVGNTRQGETARKAADPTQIPSTPDEEPPAGTNRAAARLPGGGVVFTQPTRIKEVKAPYPELLRAQQLEADVELLVSISATGKVTAVKVIRPALQPEFNEAARKAALQEIYEPATRNGVPMAYTLKFTTKFRLDTQ